MKKYNKITVSFKGVVFEMITNEKIAKVVAVALVIISSGVAIELIIHALLPNGIIH